METPRIVVLLATFNGQRWLSEQLDSLIQQAGVSVQIVAADDGSTDQTLSFLRASASRLRDLEILPSAQHGKRGASQNFFHLIRESNLEAADYVAFCDQDDIWFETKLANGVAALGASAAVGYSSAVKAVWPDGRSKVLRQNDRITPIDYLFEGAGQGCTFVIAGDFARGLQRFLREHSGLTSEIHYHDWAVYAIARSFGHRWIFDPQPSMVYRQHGENDTGARNAFSGIVKRISLLRNKWYLEQVRAIMHLAGAAKSGGSLEAVQGQLDRAGTLKGRLLLARTLWRSGRRRRSDRAVLTVAALMGWLSPPHNVKAVATP